MCRCKLQCRLKLLYPLILPPKFTLYVHILVREKILRVSNIYRHTRWSETTSFVVVIHPVDNLQVSIFFTEKRH